MTRVLQDRFRVDDEDNTQRGNCLQAAVASVFELPLEDVPHFVAYDDWWGVLERWCLARNIDVMYLPAEEFVNGVARCPINAFCLFIGKSPRGDFSHVVVGHRGEVVHDPHPSGDGLDGPATGAYYFLVADPAKARGVTEVAA